MFSAMEYPHWMMMAGAILVAVGFTGLAIHRNRNVETDQKKLGRERLPDQRRVGHHRRRGRRPAADGTTDFSVLKPAQGKVGQDRNGRLRLGRHLSGRKGKDLVYA